MEYHSYPVQKGEIFKLSAERVVDGVHGCGYVDVNVIIVDGEYEHDGSAHVQGDVDYRRIRGQTHGEIGKGKTLEPKKNDGAYVVALFVCRNVNVMIGTGKHDEPWPVSATTVRS